MAEKKKQVDPVDKTDDKELKELQVELANVQRKLLSTVTTGLIHKRRDLENRIAELKGKKGKK